MASKDEAIIGDDPRVGNVGVGIDDDNYRLKNVICKRRPTDYAGQDIEELCSNKRLLILVDIFLKTINTNMAGKIK